MSIALWSWCGPMTIRQQSIFYTRVSDFAKIPQPMSSGPTICHAPTTCSDIAWQSLKQIPKSWRLSSPSPDPLWCYAPCCTFLLLDILVRDDHHVINSRGKGSYSCLNNSLDRFWVWIGPHVKYVNSRELRKRCLFLPTWQIGAFAAQEQTTRRLLHSWKQAHLWNQIP